MKRKIVYTINVGDQEYEDMEGEENRNHSAASGLLYSETDRCPICLNCLLEKEVAFPESCNHVFCITCILKWAETLASCPIDRKPFQAVFKFNPLEGFFKVQVKRQLKEAKEKKTESSFKKQLSCQSSESSVRKKAIREDLLTSRFYDLRMIHRKSSDSKTGGQKNATIKIDKPRRSNQCTSHCFRNVFSDMLSSNSHTGDSFTCRAYCTEFIEVSEISALITQKRQELELSWFPDTLPGIGRVDFVPWNVETEVLPLISSMLPRSIFPTNATSLENFGTSCKGYTLAHTQEGDEKKQTSGSSNTRGSRRKPTTTTPTRRSTRNTRAETVSESQKSPVSSNSGWDAPDIPSESVSSPVESEKQKRQAPKRKSVRRGRKPPLLRKKLRRSVPSSEKTSSSDSVEEEITESDTPPVLEKEQQSGVESSNVCSLQTDVETQLSDCLKSCSEQIGQNEDHAENHDSEKKLESPDSESCNQDTPVRVREEGGIEKVENTGIEAKVLGLENEISQDTFEKQSDALENHDQVSGSPESEVKAVTCADDPPDDLPPCSGSETEVYQTVSSPPDGIPDSAEPVISEEKPVDNITVEILDPKVSAVKAEEIVESPKLDSSESEITHSVDKKSIESSDIQLLGNVETENSEITAICNTSENENISSSQGSESRHDSQLDKSLKDKTDSPVEHPKSVELLQGPIEQAEMHFSEDNNEMIPMECDSFCSDQNESEIESSVNTDSKQLSEDSMTHSSETNKASDSDPTKIKVETISQPSESPVEPTDKAKKPRTRKSRFHSPSTTWSPNKDATQEKKRSQSPSPKRETEKESKKSESPSPKKESARGRRKSRSQSPKKDMAREKRRTQSRSPKRDSTRESKRSESPSPRRDTSRENQRSQSRMKDSSKEKSRSRSRERESDRDGQRRDRDRERRTRRWSRSRSRSRSPTRSRPKSKSSFSRNERDNYSPRWKERWTNDGWRCPRGSEWYRKNDMEKQSESTRKEKNDVSLDTDDANSADKCRNDCPSWVTEKINSGPDPRTRNPEKVQDSHWEENRNENSGNSWNKNFGSSWVSNRGRGNRGRGMYRGSFAYTDQNENRWQNRKPLSGNSNSSGNDSFKYMEQQPYKRKNEQESSFDTPADRSGWTSASSWAVRKNLPMDVQNYYSRRGRSSSGSQSGWMRQEEEATEQDSNIKDQTNQQVDSSQLPINMMPPQMNIIPQQMNAQHQPMNIFPYPMGVHAPLMNIQRSPFNMHPQLPLHLHTGMPLMQMAAPTSVTQGPPPPPPPPPPSQQVSYIASHPDGNQSQGIPSGSHVSNNMSTPVLSAPTAAPGSMETVQGPSSGNTPSSSHSKASNAAVKLAESKVSVTVEASADSSKTDKKLQIQEKAAQEVKLAIKPFYQNKDITKEEYKEIVRKAVDKVCHSKSGEVNSAKVANLVKAYVDKYKYSRKGSQKKTLDESMSTEKNIG